MHEILAKIARLAFSKGAAFCYAVTVGVSGQLAYNYLQPRDPASTPVAAPSPSSLASVPAVSAKPALLPPAATAPILPEPPSLSLPSLAALPAPALKPAVLPPSRPAVVTPVEPSAAPVEPAQKPAAPVTATLVPLPDTLSPNITPYHRAAEEARPTGNPDAAVAGPIPLLPLAGAAEVEKAALPAAKPGPGSGGLY